MSTVEAIYQQGIFKPLGEVVLPDNQRVLLHVEPFRSEEWQTWLEQARELQQRLAGVRGMFDSTREIAADRRR
jgi:predicted DNA-binding antitoxin AbrB/MazE fold protein